MHSKEDLALTRSWWAGKSNRPSKEYYRILTSKYFIPALIKEDQESSEDNINYVHRYYSNIFASEHSLTPLEGQARRKISFAETPTICKHFSSNLDSPV